MTKISQTVVFFGNERLATGVSTTAPTLQALVSAGYNVKAVIANHEDPVSRQKRDLEIGPLAHSLGIPVILPGKKIPLATKVEHHKADLGILIAFGKIIPKNVIELFPQGIINVHPSLLPLHRGPTPIESVILEGATETGVSLMKLVKSMDAGPIYAQASVRLSGKETKQELSDRLIVLGKDLLIKHLPDILSGSLKPLPQDETKATYDGLITKKEGLIDWSKPAEQIEREIRAFSEWPKSHTKLGKIEVIITKAHTVPTDGKPGEIHILDNKDALIVYCGSGYLGIDKIKPIGKKEMSTKEFIRGYKDQIGQQAG